MGTALSNGSTTYPGSARDVWIRSPGWDVGWLIASALVVPVVLLFVWKGVSSDVINLGVTALIGGPHLFSTYLATYLDPRFRRHRGWLLLAAGIGVPAFVVFWTLVNFQILLSVFIFAASLHVLQQNAFLSDVYRRRQGRPEATWSRVVDYGLLMICIYPIASYKLVHGAFVLGDVPILIPPFLMTPATYYVVWIAFAVLLVAWLGKTWQEQRAGVLNVPKTLLIGVTTVVGFLAPVAASGTRLELSFQAVNAWHSIQYLGIVWYVQKLRKDQGLIESPFVRSLSGSGAPAYRFYGAICLTTVVLFGVVVGVAKADPLGISFNQYYYMGVLSCLLVHYVLDAYLFTVSNREHASPELVPFAVAARGPRDPERLVSEHAVPALP
jgi:hypothetical protein